MTGQTRSATDAHTRRVSLLWQIAWLIAALAYAVPVAYSAYGRVIETDRQARERLIIEYRLWEVDIGYRGTPQAWTRFAARLLTDGQLMRRVRVKYGDLATEIELDYQRDLAIARAEVVFVAAATWAFPAAALYLAGFLLFRRRRAPAEAPKPLEKPAYSESRYRP